MEQWVGWWCLMRMALRNNELRMTNLRISANPQEILRCVPLRSTSLRMTVVLLYIGVFLFIPLLGGVRGGYSFAQQNPNSTNKTQAEWTIYNTSNSGLPENKIKSITRDENGTIWLGTAGEGVVKFDGKDKWSTYNEFNSGNPGNHVDSIAIDQSGNVWVATGNGVAKFDRDTTWTVYNTSNSGLPDNDTYPIAIDRTQEVSALREDELSLWIGTFNGLARFDGTNWKTYNTSNSPIPGNLVRSIAIDRDGNKWIGTLYDGLAKFNGDATWEKYADFNSGLPNNDVYPITFDKEGNIWIGTNGGGLAKFDGTTNWTIYNKSNSGLPDNKIYSMTIDKTGTFWIGTVEGGLAKFDPSAVLRTGGDTTLPDDAVAQAGWTVYNTFNSGLSNNEVRGITIDGDGNKWIATYGGGLALFNENGKGWTGTEWNELAGFDPETSANWSIEHIKGMVKKFEVISEQQRNKVAQKSDDYLNLNPEDVQALILQVQIGIALKKNTSQLHEVLDKALNTEPGNAQVHYWKARVFGIEKKVIRDGKTFFEFNDYDKAVQFAKKAIELNPGNDLFRETLALYLAEKRKFEEARVFIKNARGGKHPVYLLLRDLQYFPLHNSTIFLPEATEGLMKAVKEKGELTDYNSLRAHVFSVPIYAEELEEYFEKFLPEFNLFEVKRDKKKRITVYTQYLKFWDKDMYTVNTVDEIPNRPNEGITLEIIQYTIKSSNIEDAPSFVKEMLRVSPSYSEKEVFCKISYVNYR